MIGVRRRCVFWRQSFGTAVSRSTGSTRALLRSMAAAAVVLAVGCGPSEPLDGVPDGFEIHPAFRLELAAAEPVVVDPIDLAFDERGRVFVLEFPGYPDMEQPARIVTLRDRDGDGRWDSRRLFAGNLGLADSILPWRRGLLVAAPPDLVYLEDTDGDGRADRREVLLSGFAEGNPQHNVNALRYGLDNWIHGVNGGNGARVFWPGSPDDSVDIGQDDFRVDFNGRRFERMGRGAGGFGMSFDPWGRRFDTHNLDHLSQVVIPRRYLSGLPARWQNGRLRLAAHPDGGPAELFPIGERPTRPNHPEQSSRFSAACAITVYAGGVFGAAGTANHELNVFVADPSANVVHRAVVDIRGAVAAAERGRPGIEFLASADSLFRPVQLVVGPSGELYVVDMHRGVIEHPEWIPDRMERELDLYEADDRGRIYRIVPRDGLPPGFGSFHGLDREKPEELIETLGHPNRWRRLSAQRLLVEEYGEAPPPAVVAALRERLRAGEQPLLRLHALWTLSGVGALDAASLAAALRDPHADVRRNAVLAAEELLSRGTIDEESHDGRGAGGEADRPAARPPGSPAAVERETRPEEGPEPSAVSASVRGTSLSNTERQELLGTLVGLIEDPDAGVRLQATLSAGFLVDREGVADVELAEAVTSAVAAAPGSEPGAGRPGSGPTLPVSEADGQWLRLVAVSALAADPVGALGVLLGRDRPAPPSAADVVERIAALVPPDRLAEVFADDRVRRTLSGSAEPVTAVGRALLDGLAAAASSGEPRGLASSILQGPLRRLRLAGDAALAASAWRLSAAFTWEPSVEETSFLDCAGQRAADAARPVEERLLALELFGLRRRFTPNPPNVNSACPDAEEAAPRSPAAGGVPAGGAWLGRMGVLLEAVHPAEVQRAAMAELEAARQDEVTAYLVANWPRLGPAARSDAAGYLIRGRGRHGALLDAIENGRIQLGEMNFDLERRRFLLRSPDPDVRSRARTLFDDAGVVTRSEAIRAMRPALALEGDPSRGEARFRELCARCHRKDGLGRGPGPDLTGIGRRSAETLLHDILDPNAGVDTAWVNYIVETVDGEVFSGLLAEVQHGGGVVLRAADDAVIEVAADRVRDLRSDGLSMMPEALEAGLEPADMADLLAFLGRR